jgi:hypothetical protein
MINPVIYSAKKTFDYLFLFTRYVFSLHSLEQLIKNRQIAAYDNGIEKANRLRKHEEVCSTTWHIKCIIQ